MANEKLKAAIYDHLPEIDELLTHSGVIVSKRPLQAAHLFLRYFVLEIQNDAQADFTKDDFIKSEHFFSIFLPIVSDWYWEKYGELARVAKGQMLTGVATSYIQPLLLKFPITTTRVEKELETAWMTFPDHLQDSEKLGDIVDTRVSIEKMKKEDLHLLEEEVREVVAFSRCINLKLNTADLSAEVKNMAAGVWNHFDKAVADILQLKDEAAAAACWELHLAVEKTFKTFISQATGIVEHGHDLNKLCKSAEQHGLKIDADVLTALPSANEAIRMRYAEAVTSPANAAEHYKQALKIVYEISAQLKATWKLNNASFLIKMAPWAR